MIDIHKRLDGCGYEYYVQVPFDNGNQFVGIRCRSGKRVHFQLSAYGNYNLSWFGELQATSIEDAEDLANIFAIILPIIREHTSNYQQSEPENE